ncbi:MAG: M28 family peptidase [Anaerolineae bacterium]
MKPDDLTKTAESYLETLCGVVPNRRMGSRGNQEATDFFADNIRAYGYEVDTTPFHCLDYVHGGASLTHDGHIFEDRVNPYSLGCDVLAELVAVSTVEQLRDTDCRGKILLMKGPLCVEQLMPKNFGFYNPERHRRIIALLEASKPAGVVTATGRDPEQAGALSPFPLINDGDFDIPGVFCRDSIGEVLAGMEGDVFRLSIDARRVPSAASNVIALRNRNAARKIVVTAHIDAYEGSPGAVDNASGTAVLLLLAGMLSDYDGDHGVEIAAFNGEDHYSAGGQMDYLRRYGDKLDTVLLAVNVDGVGYRKGRSAYSFYGCSAEVEKKGRMVFQALDGVAEGEPWFAGDHMLFVQAGVPAVAFTSELASELMRTVTHTPLDRPELIEARQLVEVARTLDVLVRALSGS